MCQRQDAADTANEGATPGPAITPEMVQAGFRALSSSGIADEYLEADKISVIEIYQAMRRLEVPSRDEG